MDIVEIKFGFMAVLSIISGVVGAVGFWFAIKGRLDLLKQQVETLQNDKKIAHERISKLSIKVDQVEKYGPEIKLELKEMELRLTNIITKSIHDIRKRDE